MITYTLMYNTGHGMRFYKVYNCLFEAKVDQGLLTSAGCLTRLISDAIGDDIDFTESYDDSELFKHFDEMELI